MPSCSAAELFASLDASPDALIALVKQPEACEIVDALSRAQQQQMWQRIGRHVEVALDAAEPAMQQPADDEQGEAIVSAALSVLHGATILARHAISDADHEAAPEVLQVAEQLHDIIFDLQDPRASALQSAIVELCEEWWLGERAGGDQLVPQTISYLLVRALQDSATAADVRRLYAFRTALTVLDYADESIMALKKLLLHCLIQPTILRNPEGRKLCVYFFGLHPPFILEMHRAIKAQIPVCRKSLRELYGEVYFRAWRAASGVYLEKIEEGCLQDLMFHAVHASSTMMATALRQVLDYTHQQKRQRGVDQMLLRLYEPILWRSLKVANPHVRRNAATLFVEAFPLQDPTKPMVELDTLLQMQFEALASLLRDSAVAVRVVAVQGVCRVTALYFPELLPLQTARGLLLQLVRELAHDASANTVRVAVFQGLKYLVAQNSSAACLSMVKGLLPPLAPLLNDGSERVRAALLDLLLELNKAKTFAACGLLKPEPLLRRLPLEPTPLQQRLTRLLLPHFLPVGKGAAQHLGRLLTLVKGGGPTAAALLRHTPSLATPPAVVTVLVLLLGAALSGLEPAALLAAAGRVAELPPPPKSRAPPAAEVEALCRGLATLMDAAGALLQAPAHAAARAALLQAFTPAAMARLHAAARCTPEAERAMMRVAAWLPAEQSPELSTGCLTTLAQQPSDASPALLAPLLQCVCAWEQDGAMIAQLLAALSGGAADAPTGAKRGRPAKGGKAVKGGKAKGGAAEEVEAGSRLSPQLALRVLWAALDTATTREVLLGRHAAEMRALLPALRDTAEAGLAASELRAGGAAPTEALLALSCQLQLLCHLSGAAEAPPPRAKSAAAAAAALALQQGDACEETRAALRDLLGWLSATCPAEGGAGTVALRPPSPSATALVAAAAELTPGEARPRARARRNVKNDENDDQNASPDVAPRAAKAKKAAAQAAAAGAGEAADAAAAAGGAVRALMCAWLAEAAGVGLLDAPLAAQAVGFVADSLRLARAGRVGSVARQQLLGHATKLALHLFDAGSLEGGDGGTAGGAAGGAEEPLCEHGATLLFTLLSVGAGWPEAPALVRALLLDVLALLQSEAQLSGELLRRLLSHVMGAMPAAPPSEAIFGGLKAGGGPAALQLPPLASEVLEVLLRSSSCSAALLPRVHQILHASRAAPPAALRCLRLLLACESLHRYDLPGRLPLRRLVQDLLDEHQQPADAPEDGAVATGVPEACEAVLGALAA